MKKNELDEKLDEVKKLRKNEKSSREAVRMCYATRPRAEKKVENTPYESNYGDYICSKCGKKFGSINYKKKGFKKTKNDFKISNHFFLLLITDFVSKLEKIKIDYHLEIYCADCFKEEEKIVLLTTKLTDFFGDITTKFTPNDNLEYLMSLKYFLSYICIQSNKIENINIFDFFQNKNLEIDKKAFDEYLDNLPSNNDIIKQFQNYHEFFKYEYSYDELNKNITNMFGNIEKK